MFWDYKLFNFLPYVSLHFIENYIYIYIRTHTNIYTHTYIFLFKSGENVALYFSSIKI